MLVTAKEQYIVVPLLFAYGDVCVSPFMKGKRGNTNGEKQHKIGYAL